MALPLDPLPAAGFLLASYAVIGNDALQTLGPFLAANRGRTPRPLQAAFLCGVLCLVLLLGWQLGGGEPAWGRLERFPLPARFGWADLLPPLAVLGLTRWGAPVSTSFLVLTAFAPANLPSLLGRSLAGYGLALLAGALLYGGVAWLLRRRDGAEAGPAGPQGDAAGPGSGESDGRWLALQWAATGWLWGQWLVQDLANLYVYLPRRLSGGGMALSLLVLCAGVCLLLAQDGGPIQGLIRSKSELEDPRASTLLAALYGALLFALAATGREPLSTTWVFLGLLAGRELGLQIRLRQRSGAELASLLGGDVARALLGLAVSVAVALAVPPLKALG